MNVAKELQAVARELTGKGRVERFLLHGAVYCRIRSRSPIDLKRLNGDAKDVVRDAESLIRDIESAGLKMVDRDDGHPSVVVDKNEIWLVVNVAGRVFNPDNKRRDFTDDVKKTLNTLGVR
jgi:hypothetical protein